LNFLADNTPLEEKPSPFKKHIFEQDFLLNNLKKNFEFFFLIFFFSFFNNPTNLVTTVIKKLKQNR